MHGYTFENLNCCIFKNLYSVVQYYPPTEESVVLRTQTIVEQILYFYKNYLYYYGEGPHEYFNLSCFLGKIVNEIKPLKVYNDFKNDRIQLIKDLQNKTGVYCSLAFAASQLNLRAKVVNKINGNIYIGSASNLAVSPTERNYLNINFLKKKKNIGMPIVQALLKYGSENFAVLIIEFVDINNLAIRETHYITQLLPHYNILKQGYSSIGYKHTEETKNLLSDLAKNRTHSEKTFVFTLKTKVGNNNPFYNKNHSIKSKLKMIEANSANPIYIYNSFSKLLVIFPSVTTLAKLIKSNHSTIVKYIKNGNLFRGEWYFTFLPKILTDTPLISNWSTDESKNLIYFYFCF